MWSCHACTYENQHSALACEICETPRPTPTPTVDPFPHPAVGRGPAQDLPPPALLSAATAPWTCSRCTLENEAAASICAACGGPSGRVPYPSQQEALDNDDDDELALAEEEQLAIAMAASRAEAVSRAAPSLVNGGAVGLSKAWTGASEEEAIRESLRDAHGPRAAVASQALRVAGDSRGTASELVGLTAEEELALAMLKSRVAAEEPPEPPNPRSHYQHAPPPPPPAVRDPRVGASDPFAPLGPMAPLGPLGPLPSLVPPPAAASKAAAALSKKAAVGGGGLKASLLSDQHLADNPMASSGIQPLVAPSLAPPPSHAARYQPSHQSSHQSSHQPSHQPSYQSNYHQPDYQPPAVPTASMARSAADEGEEEWDDCDDVARPLQARDISAPLQVPNPHARQGGGGAVPGRYAPLE